MGELLSAMSAISVVTEGGGGVNVRLEGLEFPSPYQRRLKRLKRKGGGVGICLGSSGLLCRGLTWGEDVGRLCGLSNGKGGGSRPGDVL